MEFRSFRFHEHRLMLNQVIDEETPCDACCKYISGPAYSCSDCMFYTHKSCAETEFRDFIFHEHPLMLNKAVDEEAVCDACGKILSSPAYRCSKCDFDIHKSCAEMEFRYFDFHEHPMMLIDATDEQAAAAAVCDACSKMLSGPAYTCGQCDFDVHKSCAELPQVFQNPYHPHLFTLVTAKRHLRGFKCVACLKNRFGFFFHCGKCNFDLDITCALWKLTTNEGQDRIHHLTHFHPLVAAEEKKKQDNSDDVSCKICGEPSSDVLYSCGPCNFYLHRSCGKLQLPPTLQHFYHPCLLTLGLDKKGSNCKACGKFDDFYSYLCKPCSFRIDICCALFPIVKESRGQQQFLHFSHGHPLIKLTGIKHDDEILCSACQKRCSGQTYACCSSKCKFFLHDSYFNLPQKICHPIHPQHLLTLYSRVQRQSRPECRICYRFCSGFTYSCMYCSFHVHVECPVMISTIKYQGHHHKIFFVDGLDTCQTEVDDDVPCPKAADGDDDPSIPMTNTILLCDACCTRCKYSTSMFHCVECDFHLHVKCGLLPCSIKHESHLCTLKLTYSPVLVEREHEDNDDFYCDACEKKRDPRLPVYYCSDGCAYIAEIKCVLLEVLLSLRGEYGRVDLRSAIFKHKIGEVICKGIEVKWQDTVAKGDTDTGKLGDQSLLDQEKSEIVIAFASALNNDQHHDQWSSSSFKGCTNLVVKMDTFNTDKSTFLYSEEDYSKFMASLDSINYDRDLLGLLEYSMKNVVNVDNHLVSNNLAPILEDMCSKYRDIIPESTLQHPRVRTFFVNKLCETVKGMCTTRVVDISEAQLFSWWRYLKTLKHLGFKVEFVLDRLRRVAHAYYALQVEKGIKKDSNEIDRKIKHVSQHIKELEANLVAQNAKLVALQERRERIESPKLMSSRIVAECFKEAPVLKWTIAGEDLL